MGVVFLIVIIVIAVWVLASCVRIVPQAYAVILERLGAYQATWSTGIHFKVPFIERVARKVNLKEQVVDFPPQPVITKDNVTMQIDTVVFFQITDPKLYTYGVENPIMAIENLSATTLRNIIGDMELDETLTSRETINTKMRASLDEATDPWGIKVNRVELKNIIPPAAIQDAMEKQMKAERERREAILIAEGQKKSTILVAEGKKESAILDAEAEKQAAILRAEAHKEATIREAEGQAEAILKVHGQNVKMSDDVDYNAIARATAGASGAELANIINEAALGAVRHHRMAVTQYDLQEAVDTILAGAQKKNKILSDKEKCIVAYHEVGHAMVAALQSHSAPVQKITIVPRTSGALGFTMQVEDGDHPLMTKEEILAKIATMTGGRAAEEVVFNSITTGASNDIEQATKMARAMITRYGMTDDFDMVALETVNNAYLGGDASLACSERTAATVDDKVVEVVKQQHEKAKQMLIENRGKLDEIAKYLYEKETITGEEFMRILTAVPQLPTGAVEQ